jgi:hypothetical protein
MVVLMKLELLRGLGRQTSELFRTHLDDLTYVCCTWHRK